MVRLENRGMENEWAKDISGGWNQGFLQKYLRCHWTSGSGVKNPICQCRRHGFNPRVRKIPWRRKWHPTPVFLPGKSHGQRSLVGYRPWGLKESDTTHWLNDKKVPLLVATGWCWWCRQNLSELIWYLWVTFLKVKVLGRGIWLQKLEADKISFNREMYKQAVVHPYNWILFSDKRELAIKSCQDIDEFQIHSALWMKLV